MTERNLEKEDILFQEQKLYFLHSEEMPNVNKYRQIIVRSVFGATGYEFSG